MNLFAKLRLLFVEFPTTRTELNAVFDMFDRHRSGEINYLEFMEALRPERQVSACGIFSRLLSVSYRSASAYNLTGKGAIA